MSTVMTDGGSRRRAKSPVNLTNLLNEQKRSAPIDLGPSLTVVKRNQDRAFSEYEGMLVDDPMAAPIPTYFDRRVAESLEHVSLVAEFPWMKHQRTTNGGALVYNFGSSSSGSSTPPDQEPQDDIHNEIPESSFGEGQMPTALEEIVNSLLPSSEDNLLEFEVCVGPGVYMPLRSTKETMKAILEDFYIPISCFGCEEDLFCIQDAKYCICPHCQTISPLELAVEGDEDGQHRGVGLGFTADTLILVAGEDSMQGAELIQRHEMLLRNSPSTSQLYQTEEMRTEQELNSPSPRCQTVPQPSTTTTTSGTKPKKSSPRSLSMSPRPPPSMPMKSPPCHGNSSNEDDGILQIIVQRSQGLTDEEIKKQELQRRTEIESNNQDSHSNPAHNPNSTPAHHPSSSKTACSPRCKMTSPTPAHPPGSSEGASSPYRRTATSHAPKSPKRALSPCGRNTSSARPVSPKSASAPYRRTTTYPAPKGGSGSPKRALPPPRRTTPSSARPVSPKRASSPYRRRTSGEQSTPQQEQEEAMELLHILAQRSRGLTDEEIKRQELERRKQAEATSLSSPSPPTTEPPIENKNDDDDDNDALLETQKAEELSLNPIDADQARAADAETLEDAKAKAYGDCTFDDESGETVDLLRLAAWRSHQPDATTTSATTTTTTTTTSATTTTTTAAVPVESTIEYSSTGQALVKHKLPPGCKRPGAYAAAPGEGYNRLQSYRGLTSSAHGHASPTNTNGSTHSLPMSNPTPPPQSPPSPTTTIHKSNDNVASERRSCASSTANTSSSFHMSPTPSELHTAAVEPLTTETKKKKKKKGLKSMFKTIGKFAKRRGN